VSGKSPTGFLISNFADLHSDTEKSPSESYRNPKEGVISGIARFALHPAPPA